MNPQPMPRGLDLTSELLTSQGRALRALAQSLLRDPHAADDVVQETWLTCLRQPGALPLRMSAWLGTVTRRLALRRRRGEDRRLARERAVAVPERQEDRAQRALEREEALRAVTQALLTLEEPFKTALLLRYYEDKTPRAIADELALPLPTVKSRLARGLEKLRARLGTEFRGDEGSRRRGLLALAGTGAPAVAVTGGAAAGGLALGSKLWAAAAAAVVAGGALAWWGARPETRGAAARGAIVRRARPADRAGEVRTRALDPSGTPAAGGGSEDRREAVAAAPERAEAFAPETSFRYRIAGRVRDEHDLPRGGVCVYLAPRLFPFNRVATTGDDGCFVLEFDARRATLDAALGFAGSGLELGLREVRLIAGQELAVDVGLHPTTELRIQENRITLGAGDGEAGGVVYSFPGAPRTLVEQAGVVLSARLHLPGAVEARLAGAPEWLRRSDGRGLFVDPMLGQACGRPAESAITLELSRMGSEHLAFERFHTLDLAVAAYVEAPATATLRGVVRNASGEPVPGVEVGWRLRGGGRLARVGSDACGAFVLADVPSGPIELCAGGGDQGVAAEPVVLAGGQEFVWNPVLERGAEVAGRLVTERGEALGGQRVELWSASPSRLWCDATRTDEEGRFAIPNVPSGSFELCVYLAGSGSPFPARVVAPIFPGAELGAVEVGPDQRAGRPLVLRLAAPSQASLPGTELRVCQDATGFVALADAADDGTFAFAHLPSGTYRVEAGGPLGRRSLGTIWVDPRAEGTLDLGTELFPAPGFARIEAGRWNGSLALWSAHADVFGHVTACGSAGPSTLVLRPGDYVLCAREGSARAETHFTVSSGEGSVLALTSSQAGPSAQARPLAPDSQASEAMRCDACHAAPHEVEGVELPNVGLEAF